METMTSAGPHAVGATPEWVEEYLLGSTLEQIAQRTGVSKQQVANRLKARNIPMRSNAETLALREKNVLAQHGEVIRERFLETRDPRKVAVQLGVPEPTVRRFIEKEIPDFRVLTRAPRNPAKRYTREDLLTSLVEAAAATAGTLTNTGYEEFVGKHPVLEDGRPRPGKQVMGLRYGSWRAALNAAGLPANPRSGPSKHFDESAAVAAIVACWNELERPPSGPAYDRWQRGKDQRPSTATARKLVESWDLGLIRAWQIVHGILLDQDDTEVTVPEVLAQAPTPELGTESDGATYRRADESAALSASLDLSLHDYQQLERAVRSHARIQNALAVGLSAAGVTPLSPTPSGPQFDLAFTTSDGAFTVVEVKSCTEKNLELQLRLGLGQVLHYSHQLRSRHERVQSVLATELNPAPEWVDLLCELGVKVIREASLQEDLELVLLTPSLPHWTPPGLKRDRARTAPHTGHKTRTVGVTSG